MPWSKNDFTFKKLANRLVTSELKAFYEEQLADVLDIHAREVRSESINPNPVQAVLDGVAEERTLFTLTEDNTVPNQQGWFAEESSERLGGWISAKYGVDYDVKLYDGNDNQIFPTDGSDWLFDPITGILIFDGDTSSIPKPFKISGYRYIGGFLDGTATDPPQALIGGDGITIESSEVKLGGDINSNVNLSVKPNVIFDINNIRLQHYKSDLIPIEEPANGQSYSTTLNSNITLLRKNEDYISVMDIDGNVFIHNLISDTGFYFEAGNTVLPAPYTGTFFPTVSNRDNFNQSIINEQNIHVLTAPRLSGRNLLNIIDHPNTVSELIDMSSVTLNSGSYDSTNEIINYVYDVIKNDVGDIMVMFRSKNGTTDAYTYYVFNVTQKELVTLNSPTFNDNPLLNNIRFIRNYDGDAGSTNDTLPFSAYNRNEIGFLNSNNELSLYNYSTDSLLTSSTTSDYLFHVYYETGFGGEIGFCISIDATLTEGKYVSFDETDLNTIFYETAATENISFAPEYTNLLLNSTVDASPLMTNRVGKYNNIVVDFNNNDYKINKFEARPLGEFSDVLIDSSLDSVTVYSDQITKEELDVSYAAYPYIITSSNGIFKFVEQNSFEIVTTTKGFEYPEVYEPGQNNLITRKFLEDNYAVSPVTGSNGINVTNNIAKLTSDLLSEPVVLQSSNALRLEGSNVGLTSLTTPNVVVGDASTGDPISSISSTLVPRSTGRAGDYDYVMLGVNNVGNTNDTILYVMNQIFSEGYAFANNEPLPTGWTGDQFTNVRITAFSNNSEEAIILTTRNTSNDTEYYVVHLTNKTVKRISSVTSFTTGSISSTQLRLTKADIVDTGSGEYRFSVQGGSAGTSEIIIYDSASDEVRSFVSGQNYQIDGTSQSIGDFRTVKSTSFASTANGLAFTFGLEVDTIYMLSITGFYVYDYINNEFTFFDFQLPTGNEDALSNIINSFLVTKYTDFFGNTSHVIQFISSGGSISYYGFLQYDIVTKSILSTDINEAEHDIGDIFRERRNPNSTLSFLGVTPNNEYINISTTFFSGPSINLNVSQIYTDFQLHSSAVSASKNDTPEFVVNKISDTEFEILNFSTSTLERFDLNMGSNGLVFPPAYEPELDNAVTRRFLEDNYTPIAASQVLSAGDGIVISNDEISIGGDILISEKTINSVSGLNIEGKFNLNPIVSEYESIALTASPLSVPADDYRYLDVAQSGNFSVATFYNNNTFDSYIQIIESRVELLFTHGTNPSGYTGATMGATGTVVIFQVFGYNNRFVLAREWSFSGNNSNDILIIDIVDNVVHRLSDVLPNITNYVGRESENIWKLFSLLDLGNGDYLALFNDDTTNVINVYNSSTTTLKTYQAGDAVTGDVTTIPTIRGSVIPYNYTASTSIILETLSTNKDERYLLLDTSNDDVSYVPIGMTQVIFDDLLEELDSGTEIQVISSFLDLPFNDFFLFGYVYPDKVVTVNFAGISVIPLNNAQTANFDINSPVDSILTFYIPSGVPLVGVQDRTSSSFSTITLGSNPSLIRQGTYYNEPDDLSGTVTSNEIKISDGFAFADLNIFYPSNTSPISSFITNSKFNIKGSGKGFEYPEVYEPGQNNLVTRKFLEENYVSPTPIDISSDLTVLSGESLLLVVDTSISPVEITLPASPVDKQKIKVKDDGNASNNNITITGGGNQIDDSSNAVINQDLGTITIEFVSSLNKWVITSAQQAEAEPQIRLVIPVNTTGQTSFTIPSFEEFIDFRIDGRPLVPSVDFSINTSANTLTYLEPVQLDSNDTLEFIYK